jgi:pimeloyl-ACP methyl ester carboxylesterase
VVSLGNPYPDELFARLHEAVAAIGVPMLSLIHAHAWAGFTEAHEALVAAGAESARILGTSHLLQITNPDAVAGGIATYLRA